MRAINSADYYLKREADQLRMAARARDRGIANIHRELAKRYRALITAPIDQHAFTPSL